MTRINLMPKYFVVTNELDSTPYKKLSDAVLKCKFLFNKQKQFILLDSSQMYTQFTPLELTMDLLDFWNTIYLVKATTWFDRPAQYTFVYCSEQNLQALAAEPLKENQIWIGFYKAADVIHFERFTKKFETFQDLLLANSTVMEGITSILTTDMPIEHALLLDQHAYQQQAETQRLILNDKYNDLRNQLRQEEKIKKQQNQEREKRNRKYDKYENATLEDLASNFGDIEIDPDSLYDRW